MHDFFDRLVVRYSIDYGGNRGSQIPEKIGMTEDKISNEFRAQSFLRVFSSCHGNNVTNVDARRTSRFAAFAVGT